jgi:hypothetical protein
MPPTKSLRLQALERVRTVLQAITTGATYWKQPYEVLNKAILLEQMKAFPTYMVFTAPSDRTELAGAPDNYNEVFQVTVCGIVEDKSDPPAALEKALQDVRKAINTDSKLQTAGALGNITLSTTMYGQVKTDEGLLSSEGFAYFEQPVDVLINGDFGEL